MSTLSEIGVAPHGHEQVHEGTDEEGHRPVLRVGHEPVRDQQEARISQPADAIKVGDSRPTLLFHGLNLTSLLKIKLRGSGIRVVYKLVGTESHMLVIVVDVRKDEEAYKIAYARRTRHKL